MVPGNKMAVLKFWTRRTLQRPASRPMLTITCTDILSWGKNTETTKRTAEAAVLWRGGRGGGYLRVQMGVLMCTDGGTYVYRWGGGGLYLCKQTGDGGVLAWTGGWGRSVLAWTGGWGRGVLAWTGGWGRGVLAWTGGWGRGVLAWTGGWGRGRQAGGEGVYWRGQAGGEGVYLRGEETVGSCEDPLFRYEGPSTPEVRLQSKVPLETHLAQQPPLRSGLFKKSIKGRCRRYTGDTNQLHLHDQQPGYANAFM